MGQLIDILRLCRSASYQKGVLLKMADDAKWELFLNSQDIKTEARYFGRAVYKSRDRKNENRFSILRGSTENRRKKLQKYDSKDLEKNEKNKRTRRKSTTAFSP